MRGSPTASPGLRAPPLGDIATLGVNAPLIALTAARCFLVEAAPATRARQAGSCHRRTTATRRRSGTAGGVCCTVCQWPRSSRGYSGRAPAVAGAQATATGESDAVGGRLPGQRHGDRAKPTPGNQGPSRTAGGLGKVSSPAWTGAESRPTVGWCAAAPFDLFLPLAAPARVFSLSSPSSADS